MTTRTFIAAAALATLTVAAGCDASAPTDDATTSQVALADADVCLEQCADLPCQGPGGEVWASDGRVYCNLCELQCLGLHVDKDAYYFQDQAPDAPVLTPPVVLDPTSPLGAAPRPAGLDASALQVSPVRSAPDAVIATPPAALMDCLRECEALPCQGPGGETCGSDGMLYCNLCEIRCLGLTVRKNAFCEAAE